MSYIHHQQQQGQQHHEQHGGEDGDESHVAADRQHITATYAVEIDEGTGTSKQIITAEIIPQPTTEQQNQSEQMAALEASQSLDNSSADERNADAKERNHGDADDDLIGDIAYGDRSLMRDGRPHKYPALKQYYEFGAWVGRNRKATCVSCRHQSASSQPERLIRHLKRCPSLSAHDRSIADELLAETMANKKTPGRPPGSGRKRNYKHDTDDDGDHDDLNNTNNNNDSIGDGGTPASVGLRPVKRQKYAQPARNNVDEALTRFIMVNRIPLKSISSKEFVEFVRQLNPDYRIPNQNTITNVLIPGLLNII